MGADGLFSPDVSKQPVMQSKASWFPARLTAFGSTYAEKFVPAYEAKFGSTPISIFHATLTMP